MSWPVDQGSSRHAAVTLASLPESRLVSDHAYHAIFEASSDGLVINDPDTGLVLEANPAFCRMHGYDHMVGVHPASFIHPSSQHLFLEFMRTVSQGGEFRAHARDVRRDGSIFDVEVIGREFMYRGKRAVLGVVRDISEHVREISELDRRVAERTRELDRRRSVAEGLRELLAVANAGRPLSDILALVVHQADRLLGSAASAVTLYAAGDLAALQARTSDLHSVLTPIQVPLSIEGVDLGVLTLYYPYGRKTTADDRELATTFAAQVALVIENARLRGETERRIRQQEALYRADEHLLGSLRLDDVLRSLADVAVEVLEADKSTVVIWNEAGTEAHLPAARGYLRPVETLPAAEAQFLLRTFLDGPPVLHYTPEQLPPGSRLRAMHEYEGIRSSLAAGIRIGAVSGTVFGAFGVSFVHDRQFSDAERRLVQALAQRAGMAIQNARLFEQAQQVGTLEERQRLARELHDAVTQTLFSSALIAEVVPDLWEVNPVEGRKRLEQLRRLSRGALAEMRSLLVELRPGALTELPLADLLQQLADATAGRTMLEVSVSVEGRPPAPIPADVQVALYRMAQEALTNVVKHAQARHAWLRLVFRGPAVSLTIEDDGQGFSPRRIGPGHMGVSIMRERAQGIRARLRIQSARGTGTVVSVGWRRVGRASA